MSNVSPQAPRIEDVASKRKAHTSIHLLAGLGSGLLTAVRLQPADLLKTRVQQSRDSHFLPVLRSILTSPNPISSLWRGTVPSALRTGLGSALYFGSLNAFRQAVAKHSQSANNTNYTGVPTSATSRANSTSSSSSSSSSSSVLPKLTSTQNLLTGALARVSAGFIMMPVTVLKVRYESTLYTYTSLLSATRAILQHEGPRGFFAGFGATAVRDAPYAGLYVVFYEASKTWLHTAALASGGRTSENDTRGSRARSTGATQAAGINFASGVLAAGVATSITNPFDAVKTRLQLLPGKYGNMVKATRVMLREDGMMSFFDGLGLRMARKALSSALAWTVYEELIGRAERRFAQQEQKGASVL